MSVGRVIPQRIQPLAVPSPTTTFESRIVGDITPNLETRSVANAVLNTGTEVEKYAQDLDDMDPLVFDLMAVRLSLYPYPTIPH